MLLGNAITQRHRLGLHGHYTSQPHQFVVCKDNLFNILHFYILYSYIVELSSKLPAK